MIENSIEILNELVGKHPTLVPLANQFADDIDAMNEKATAVKSDISLDEKEAAFVVLSLLAHRVFESGARPETFFDVYQAEAMRTARSTVGLQATPEGALAVRGLGLAGEAGEVVDLVKKHLGHGHELPREKLVKELGDVLWYVATIAASQGIKLSEVAEANIAKLRARYPNGFNAAASKAKADEAPSFDANGSPVLP